MIARVTGPRERLHSIDWLRGIVMVLMALDHVRDYFGDLRTDPTAIASTTPVLFFTRWITHFCAPVFVLLAGTGSFLHGAGRSRAALARFLASRGLWLLVLEFTVVHFGWTQSFALGVWLLQVIAAIGVAMLVLAGLVFLPPAAVLVIGAAIVAGHNLLDPVRPVDLGALGWLWVLAHEGSMAPGSRPLVLGPEGPFVLVVYPLLPWVGVMALGYGLGPLFLRPLAERRRVLLAAGAALVATFVLLRAGNLYGDPRPWAPQESAALTVCSFLNCQKYPPSLLYLLMTLGPALLLLAVLDRRQPGPVGRAFAVFGRVPLFYYVVHLYAVHAAARLWNLVAHGRAWSNLQGAFAGEPAPTWADHGLGGVYAAWILIVLALYPLCVWYAGVKHRSRLPLLRYL